MEGVQRFIVQGEDHDSGAEASGAGTVVSKGVLSDGLLLLQLTESTVCFVLF